MSGTEGIKEEGRPVCGVPGSAFGGTDGASGPDVAPLGCSEWYQELQRASLWLRRLRPCSGAAREIGRAAQKRRSGSPPGSVPDIFLRPPHDVQRQGIDARGQLFLRQAQGYLLARVQVLDHDTGQDLLQGRAGETTASITFLDPSRAAVEGQRRTRVKMQQRGKLEGQLCQRRAPSAARAALFRLEGLPATPVGQSHSSALQKAHWEGACLKPSASHLRGDKKGYLIREFSARIRPGSLGSNHFT